MTGMYDDDAPWPASGQVHVPWDLVVPIADIHLVGYGNRFPNDFTLEMLAVLKRCTRIFAVPPLHAPDFGIPPMESLLNLYSPGRKRLDTYAEMLDTVLEAASDPPVAFATYGSAMVGVQVAHRLIEEAHQRGLTTHVTNAPSCFDGIWADFNIEPFYGLEVWEASTFTRLRIQPNTGANLLLPQAPVLDVAEGLDPGTMRIRASTTITRLRDHLLTFYPPGHLVHYVKTGSGAGPHLASAGIESIMLRDLDHPGHQPSSTLFVPRAVSGPRALLDYNSPARQGAQSL